MQRVAFPVATTLFLLLSITFAQAPANFSGTWKMDVTRSESAHQDVPIGPVTLSIRQTEEEISVETRTTEAKSSKVKVDTLTFRLDGKESINAAQSEVPIKAKAHWDGPKLVTETERVMNGSTVTTMQVLRLSANGKEVTIDKTLTVQHGYQSPGAAMTTGTGKDVFVKGAKE